MTNHWVDIKNANVVMVMGGNAAEAHPVGFRWAMEAKTTTINLDRCRSPFYAYRFCSGYLRTYSFRYGHYACLAFCAT
ncbi:hypothetical protein ACLK15_08595 [Escherichia coli]